MRSGRGGSNRRGRAIRLPVTRGSLEPLHLDGDCVHLPVMRRRDKRKAVFVANELSDLRVGLVKIFLLLREIDAPAGSAGEFAQRLVGGGKALVQ